MSNASVTRLFAQDLIVVRRFGETSVSWRIWEPSARRASHTVIVARERRRPPDPGHAAGHTLAGCDVPTGVEETMPKLRVHNLSMSLDGYAAGAAQSRDNPLGVGGEGLHEWVFETRSGRKMIGMDGGDSGVDDGFIAQGDVGIGATVMGRNMFGPIRGAWGDDPWSGWWGDDPPYHHPVFVLTHHPRPSIPMQDGTTFHFVTDGIEAALERAFEAAGAQDVRLRRGVGTLPQ